MAARAGNTVTEHGAEGGTVGGAWWPQIRVPHREQVRIGITAGDGPAEFSHDQVDHVGSNDGGFDLDPSTYLP